MNKLIVFSISFLLFFASAASVYAQTPGPALNFGAIQNQAGLGTLGGIVSAFVPYVLGAAGIALFLYVIWGGFTIMMSRGDPKATAAGKDIITRAIIGFVIIFAAYWLVQLLGLMLGISQFKNIFQ